MRKFLLFTWLVLMTGCISTPWSSYSDKINFLPSIGARLENSNCPILLTAEEKDTLIASLHGSLKKLFTDERLSEEVKVYWYESTKGINKDLFTLIRISNDKTWYANLTYFSDGQIFSEGGGQVDNDWIKGWINCKDEKNL